MKRLNGFWFGFLLSTCISVACFSFYYADIQRGYNATGGEVFMIALPLCMLLKRKKLNKTKS